VARGGGSRRDQGWSRGQDGAGGDRTADRLNSVSPDRGITAQGQRIPPATSGVVTLLDGLPSLEWSAGSARGGIEVPLRQGYWPEEGS
jgi:hypothetical protein